MGHVEDAARHVFEERAGSLVHGVARHRGHGAALARVHRGDRDGVRGHGAEDTLLAHEGLGGERRALQHLAQVVRAGFGKARADRRRREEAGVARPAGDDHVGALAERLDDRLDPHHRDQPIRAREHRGREVGSAVEALDPDAASKPPGYLVTAHLGEDRGQIEGREPVAPRQLADDLGVLVHAAIGARVGCRADDHRHAESASGQQHQLEVVPLPLFGATVLVRAERLRADVAASRVGHDRVGPAGHADLEAASLDRREPEVARRREDVHPA